MAFEYGITIKNLGEVERFPKGIARPPLLHAIARYDIDGSYETIVIRPDDEETAQIHILPQEELDMTGLSAPRRRTIEADALNGSTWVAEVTPDDPYNTHFRSEEGDEGRFYVNYLSLGARALFLADGTVVFTERLVG